MRYAYGVILGAILPLVIFLGAAVIKILALSWDVYVLWFLLSIVISLIPPILVVIVRRDLIRELLIFETGGFGLFSPLWIFLFTDITGDSVMDLLTDGIYGGLIGPGFGNTIIPLDILYPLNLIIFALCIVVGIIFLRPSFIAKYSVKGEISELRELKESAEPKAPPSAGPPGAPAAGPPGAPTAGPPEVLVADGEDPIEKEMPEVAPPQANADTMADLRGLLTELGTPEPTINLIFNSGIATTTDLVATSPEQLSSITGIDKRTAEDLHMAVQKKVWFEGI
jgi:hypothetical protein